jgi:hypothetical protein
MLLRDFKNELLGLLVNKDLKPGATPSYNIPVPTGMEKIISAHEISSVN